MDTLPDKTIERLSQYRRTLNNQLSKGKTHIFSHELANLLHVTPVLVRRDLMIIGYTGTLRKGYNIKELVEIIGSILDAPGVQKIAVIGLGNIGRGFVHYMYEKRSKLKVVAAFDNNPDKIGKNYADVYCHNIKDLNKIIKKENIKIGIITTPPDIAQEIADNLVKAGIKGILNYTPKPLSVPENVYLEEYDMITSLEKVAYFVQQK